MERKKTIKKLKYRIDLVALAALFILIVTFCAYMMNTSITDVVSEERGESIITHDYTYDDWLAYGIRPWIFKPQGSVAVFFCSQLIDMWLGIYDIYKLEYNIEV